MAFRYPPVSAVYGGSSLADPRRTHQINELLTVFPHITTARQDRSVLSYPFRLADGRPIVCEMLLPVAFPESPPRLVLSHMIQHPLVQNDRSIQLPMLHQWQPSFRLVDLIFQLEEHFNPTGALYGTLPDNRANRPPNFAGREINAANFLPHPPQPPSHSSQGSNSPVENSQQSIQETIMQYLQNCTDADLGQILVSREDFSALVYSLANDELKIPHRRHLLKEENIKLSNQNLEREKEIQNKLNQIAVVKHVEFKGASDVYDQAKEGYERYFELMDIPKMIDGFQEKAQKLDGESEQLIEEAAKSEISIPAFVEDYLRLRQEYHRADLISKAAQQRLTGP